MKVRHSPLTLNASTIESLYRHLDYSDSRYIIVPKSSIKSQNSVIERTRFAIDYFKRSYEDSDYIILEVPSIHAPNDYSNTDIALVHSDEELSLNDRLDTSLAPYDNKTFNTRIKNPPLVIQHDNHIQGIMLFSPNAGNATTVWSEILNQRTDVNSIESSFRIAMNNQNKSNNHVGLR